MKDKLLRYWFIFSSLALAVMYFLFDRRGRKLHEALMDAERAKLNAKINKIVEKASESREGYERANEEYEVIKSRYSDVLRRHGLLDSEDDGPKAG
jgi:hypothetical protein